MSDHNSPMIQRILAKASEDIRKEAFRGRDPLGLSEEQRQVSDMNQALIDSMLVPNWNRGGTGLITVPLACGYCRRYGHAEGECPSVIDGEWSEA